MASLLFANHLSGVYQPWSAGRPAGRGMAHHVPAAGGAGFLGGRRFDDHFRLHHPFRPGERPPERAPWHRAGHRHQRCHHGSGAVRFFLLPCVLAALPVGYPLWAGRGQRGCSLKQLCCPALQKPPYELAALLWGVGASLGPVIMGQALAGSGWQGGYRIIGILQVVLTVVLLFSLPLWKLPQDAMGGEPFTPQHRSFPELLKITGVPEVLVCFFVLLRTGIHRRDVGLQLLHPGARFGCPDRCQLGQPVLFGHYRRAVCFRLFDDEDERPQHDPAGAGVNCPGHSAGSAACREQRAVCGPDFDRLGLRPCLPPASSTKRRSILAGS